MVKITLKEIKVWTVIGVYEKERKKKQPLLIDLELDYDDSAATLRDDVDYALDYFTLTEEIAKRVSRSQYFLLETLCGEIVAFLKEEFRIVRGIVSIAKPRALKRAKTVVIQKEFQNKG